MTILLGDNNVGKTSLLTAYIRQKFYDDSRQNPIHSDSFEVIMAIGNNGNTVRLEINDTVGDEENIAFRTPLLKRNPIVILCFACNERESFNNITSSWMPEILDSAKDARIILCGTKSDLFEPDDEEHVSLKEAKELGKRIQAYKSLFCSSKDYCSNNIQNINAREDNVQEVFKAALKVELKGAFADEWVSNKCCTIL